MTRSPAIAIAAALSTLLLASSSRAQTTRDEPKAPTGPYPYAHDADAEAPIAPYEGEPPLAGYGRSSFYLRDARDILRLYPGARVNLDFDDFAGGGVTKVQAATGGNPVKAKLFLRRVRLELAGEVGSHVEFFSSIEWGGQPISNANGTQQQSASSAGADPTATSARFLPVEATAASAAPFDVWVNFKVTRELNFMVGQEKTTIGIENRTSDNTTPLMERNVAIRGFVVPGQREIGITAWGDVGENTVLGYEGGVYAGDGQNRPQIDNRADAIGRAFVRPFAADKSSPLAHAQIGASGRWGVRDASNVGYDEYPITTGQGWTLWNTTYKDSQGRVVHIIPSGSQTVGGGELRVPIGPFALQGEAYYVGANTREAIDGFQLTKTERLGALRGVGWYVEIEVWPCGEPFFVGDPGFVRPVHVDLKKPLARAHQALQLVATLAGVDASYDGASRGGAYDKSTPGAPNGPGTAIKIVQGSLGATYWYTRHFRAMVNANVYTTPGSGSNENLAAMPGNTLKPPSASEHTMLELGARVAVQF